MTKEHLNSIEIIITEDDFEKFNRLDVFLGNKIPDYSRNLLKKFFLEGKIKALDGTKLELKKMPPPQTIIYFEIPTTQDVDLVGENIPLEILFEDEYLIVINKPAGLVVHPAPGNYTGTLVNAILYHCPNLKGIGNEKRPGIVHRLDKGTSGVMVIAKEQKCHEGLVNLFSTHNIDRYYEAIAVGTKIPSHQTLESTIGRSPHNRLKMATNVKNGKKAITNLKVLQFFKHFSHLELKLETGRTHQIRVHLSELLKTPILNDELYGRTKEEKYLLTSSMKSLLKNYEYPFLHAKILGFIHPITGKKLYFEQEPPEIFKQIIKLLKEETSL